MLIGKKRLNSIEISAAEKAMNSENINEAYNELGKVKDQKLRTKIAIKALNPNISYFALARIESKELLEEVFKNTPHKATKKLAEDMLKKNMYRK